MNNKLQRMYDVLKISVKSAWKKYHFLVPPKKIHKGIIKLISIATGINIKYKKWIKINEKEFEYKEFEYNPLISIVIPHYNTDPQYLTECLESILNQSYKNFEICIADDSSTNKESIELLKEYEEKYSQVKVIWRKENGNISAATNSTIEIASGEYIAFMDSDDTLAKDALYWNVEALNRNKELDLIYSDEDKLDFNGRRTEPHFKPGWNPELLLSINYISHFIVARASLIKELNGCRSEYDGVQDHDLLLRLTEKTNNIYHISRMLYHWRKIEGSTSAYEDAKEYSVLNRKRMMQETLQRRNINAELVPSEFKPYFFDVLMENNNEKVSILIPTRDHIDYLKPCIESIYEKTTYKNFEIILVDHNSNEKASLEYFEECKKKYNNFKVIRRECEFNHSYLNNEAAKEATGEYLIFLNSDTEIITPNWIEYMLGQARRENIGCVGVKLLYPDNTIQHAGVVLLGNSIAGDMFKEMSVKNEEYRTYVTSNWSAVTFACAMVSKRKFDMVNGLNEELPADYNDVDFCLEMLKFGYNNVCVPAVKLYHYESKIRGFASMSTQNYDRWRKAIEYMDNKWKETLHEEQYINYFYLKQL